MPYDLPDDLAKLSLLDIAEAVAARRLPPVDQWHPGEVIDSKMRISADGTWYHEGSPIRRSAMIRAFSSLLMHDAADSRYYLVTPQCRQHIDVEDAPFLAVQMEHKDSALAFRLNTDEFVIAGPENPLRAEGDPDCPAIYLAVRHGCEARLNRSTWLELAHWALDRSDDLSVTSMGAHFSLQPK
ncbi:DUF1285 domain-containing protein [Altericroceibacterium spongiae]|uniref:DUF1285 domain-containing protein n=1 Tax=Altericroceibacterium spongiae TaxID=2320269 RepID=A0A420EMV5_9SPHN|nr:DUF1285 domain-containing protein [Altericroceibacterium spongiae]RKF21934.1 DUF1285 domain-containing protein [Altericroceibacterium spongiae]